MKDAIILLAHGARDPDWALPIEAMAARLRELKADCEVVTAYLELMSPDIESTVGGLTARGANRITVVPVFLAQGGHVKRDLPAKIEKLRAANVGLHIDLVAAIGEQPEVIDAIAASVARLLDKR